MTFTNRLFCPSVGKYVLVVAKYTLPIGGQESRFMGIEYCTEAPPCKSKGGDCQATKAAEIAT